MPPDLTRLRSDISTKLGVQASAVSKRIKRLKAQRTMGDADALGVLARQAGLPIDKKYGFDADELFRIAGHEAAITGSSQSPGGALPPSRVSKVKAPRLTRAGLFNLYGFHPEVVESGKKAFVAGLGSTAVQKAYQRLHNRVKTMTNATNELDGDNLFGWAFKDDAPQLQMSDLTTRTRKNEQKGFSLIAKGSYQGFRNPSSHDDEWGPTEDNEVLELLSIASFLHRCIDRCIEYVEIDEAE